MIEAWHNRILSFLATLHADFGNRKTWNLMYSNIRKSFFIVNKIAKMQFFDHSEAVIARVADILARVESWRDSAANVHDKRISIVGKFGEKWPAMRG